VIAYFAPVDREKFYSNPNLQIYGSRDRTIEVMIMNYTKISISITNRNSIFLNKVAKDFTAETGMGFNLSRYIQELLNEKETEYNENI